MLAPRLWNLAFVFALLLLCTGALARDPQDSRYYIANGDYLDLRLSPDAKHLAALVRSESTYALVFLKASDFSVVGGMKTANEELILEYHWVNNERVVFEIAEFRAGWELPSGTGELWAVNLDGSDVKLLAGIRAQDANSGSRIKKRERSFATFELLNTLPDDPKNILVIEHPWEQRGNWFYDTRSTFPIVSKLNVKSAKRRKVSTLPHRGANAFSDWSGRLRFMSWVDEEAEVRSAYRQSDQDPWVDGELLADATESVRVYGIDDEEDTVYLGYPEGPNEIEAIYKLQLETGMRESLLDTLESDVTNIIYDPVTSIPVAIVSVPSGPRYDYLDPKHPIARFHRSLAKAFDGQLVDIVSSDQEGNLHIVRVESDTNPGEFYVYDTRTKEARFVFANRSWMDVTKLAPKIPLSVEVRDSVRVPALLTLPSDESEEKSVLIVYAHGGPHGVRSPWQFEEEVQLLAANGFAVLQVNHRGSGGFGERFIEIGYKEWGGAMIDDIEDVVEKVLQEYAGRIKGVCAYGASFGGYASLALAARDPEWLDCAAGFAGVYDLAAKYEKGDIPTLPFGEAYLEKSIGTDEKQLRDYSPVYHADAISVPVLLIHGGKDRRVPIYHAKKMHKALLDAKKDVQLVVDGTVGHGLYSEEKRAAHWESLMDFFKKNTVVRESSFSLR